MNTKTENLLAQEIKQSDIETKVYDRDADFYQYVESDDNKTIAQTEDRPQRRTFLKTALVIAIGFCLTSGLASAFYFSSGKMSPATVNQLSAENLPKDESRAGSVEEAGSQNELEAGKSVKPDLTVEKGNLSEKDNSIRKKSSIRSKRKR